MAKFEITLTAETWTDKSRQLDEAPIKAALLKVPGLVEVDVDLDEVDYTITDTNWEISVTAEFECADGDEDPIAKRAGRALESCSLRNITWDLDEQDYDMPDDAVLEDFRDSILPLVVAQYGDDDSIAKREAFNDHTDALCKEGQITSWQYENIDNPY